MRIPYSLQGTIFAFALVALVFALKLTCPASSSGCFADFFIIPMFLPAALVSEFASASMLANLEPLVILLYWGLVGFLLGFCFDIFKDEDKSQVY